MLIRILPSLETREAWLIFLNREVPYCLVDDLAVLVDFQHTFLQVTQLNNEDFDPIRYTLGARSSMEPAWQLIKGCNWSLKKLIDGLNTLNFNSNARDNSGFSLPKDISVRKSFANEPRLLSARHLLINAKSISIASLSANWMANIIRNEQYTGWITLNKSATNINPHTACLSLSTEPCRWAFERSGNAVTLYLDGQPHINFQLTRKAPPRHLLSTEVKL